VAGAHIKEKGHLIVMSMGYLIKIDGSPFWQARFPGTVEFLREFLGQHHPAQLNRDLMRGGSRFLMPSLGMPSGPKSTP